MNDPARTPRGRDLAALAKATDANGNVDLTAFEAQRLIYRHESIDGLDAKALVRDLSRSAAYGTPGGKEQMQPLLDAIAGRLPPDQAVRFSDALDQANLTDTLLERKLEVFSENMEKAWRSFEASVGRVDASISDALADSKRWADRVRDNPENGYLERAAGRVASNSAGEAQDLYGQAKGASTHSVAMLGEVVDLAKFGARFSTDSDFRNLIIGAGLVYASETIRDPSKPVDDVRKVAVGAWNEWQQGLKEAQAQGKEQEYLGEAKGAVGIELLAAIIPATKVAKLGKLAEAIDAVDDAVPDRAGQVGRRAAGEATELVDELVVSARKAQQGAEWEADSADLMFSGLAGVKRSQGELRELVDDMRAKGQLDGLIGSGALSLRELNYLARQDVTVFDGSVPFDKAIEKWVGDRKLSELTDPMVGDMGEAIVAHKLSREGYRDLVAIQNNSGHGNDLAGINPETGRWEVVEIKASVQGIARKQGGNPEAIILDRLEKADDAKKLWAPKNMWEEQAAATATRILKDLYDPLNEKLDVDPKWARVNIERDADGQIKADPQIEDWKTPEQRKIDRQRKSEAPDEMLPQPTETSREATSASRTTVPGIALTAAVIAADDRSDRQSGIDASPHAIERASEQERGAREQAQREANREGLSLEARRPAMMAQAQTGKPGRGEQDSREADLPLDDRRQAATANDLAQPTASLPPDFAPSRLAARDIRDPQHEGNDALREMQWRAAVFETQHGIPNGEHTKCLGASSLQFALDNELRYSDLRLGKNQETGEFRFEYARYGEPTRYFPADLKQMSSQPIEVTSQNINEAVSRHNVAGTPTLERTQTQAQALGAYTFDDQVTFARIRGGTPGHISDDYIGAALLLAKQHKMDANNIAQVSMVGDQIRLLKSGPDGTAVLVDTNAPVPPLQASVEATNTFNQQQAQVLAQQQNNPTQDDPGPKGPKLS
jgi:hypothetical protein